MTLFVRGAIILQCCNTRATQRNYKSCMPTANYEDCPRCVGQACQTHIKFASWLEYFAIIQTAQYSRQTGFWESSTLKTTSRSQPPAKSSSGSVRATENQLSPTRVGSIPAFAHSIFSFCDAWLLPRLFFTYRSRGQNNRRASLVTMGTPLTQPPSCPLSISKVT